MRGVVKAEHISIASKLEDIPNVGLGCAELLRQCGLQEPLDLQGADPASLYDKICQITRKTHNVKLLDVLLSAVYFANGHAPRHWTAFSEERETLLNNRFRHSRQSRSDGTVNDQE